VLILGSAGGDGRTWPSPVRVDAGNSAALLQDCADALGRMLAADVDRAEIIRRWEALLR
jgi:hypothetical protein